MTGSNVGERGGARSGMVLKPGFELETPVVQRLYMSARCPQGADLQPTVCLSNK